ncbi:MAG: hypothetical protein ACKVOA_10935 [Methylophilaceae bacterium]
MPLTLKLPKIDDNPILLAETRANKINEFIQNLPYGDPIRAASDLVEELQILNSQKVAFTNRLNALELYRPAALQVYQSLIPHFSNASIPISKNELAFAGAAEQLWHELALGYKFALVDLQNKILNLNNDRSTALVVQRAIHALKEITLIYYMAYRTPSPTIWAELHQLYFCAIQQSADQIAVADGATNSNESTVCSVYMQVLLMALANPNRLANQDILKVETYLANIATDAELRPLGLIDNPTGIFLIELDGDKPPTPYTKNRDIPNPDTDIILLTLNLARRIHAHLKALKNGVVPSDGSLPVDAMSGHFEDLLTHLIKHFGKTPQRVFSRSKKSDGLELGIGMHSAHHFIPKVGSEFKNFMTPNSTLKPSRWQILNVGAGGYALRKFNSSQAEMHIGDIAAIKNSNALNWELGVVRWANINDLNQLDAGIELISPSATSVNVKAENETNQSEGLLLPEIIGLKQPASVIVTRGKYLLGQALQLNHNDRTTKVLISKLVERTTTFERFQFDLI